MTRLPTVDIVEFDARWEEAHTAFASRNWPGKRRRRDPGFNRWKFRGAPEGPVRGLLLAVHEGQVIGQLGLLPGKMVVDGEEHAIQWACDFMVDADQRSLGAGSQLLDVGVARPEITLATDLTPSATGAMAKRGFKVRQTSQVMILTLEAGPVVSVRYPQAQRFEPLVTAAARPAVRLLNRRLVRSGRSSTAHACGWRDIANLLVAHDPTVAAPHAVHDAEFLAWRAAGLEPWTRDLDAVVTDQGSFALFEREPARLTVHQWHAVDEAEAAAVFGRILYIAGGYGVSRVQAYASDSGEAAVLTALGYRARRTPVEVWSYPAEPLASHPLPFAFTGYDSDYLL